MSFARIAEDTLREHFPETVWKDLTTRRHARQGLYYHKAEELVRLSCPITHPLQQLVIDQLNRRSARGPQKTDSGWPLPSTQWEWGRIASRFNMQRNFAFPEGGYSVIDRLLVSAMNDVEGKDACAPRILLNAQAIRLEPKPTAKGGSKPLPKVSHVVVDVGGTEHKIKCRRAVLSAGSVESAAILLRSADGEPSNYGGDFEKGFGHVTDHHMFYVSLPFVYRNMEYRNALGGMKLQTDITFRDRNNKSHTTALVNMSLDGESFLPRGCLTATGFPQLVIVFMMVAELAQKNSVQLDENGRDPVVNIDFAEVADLKEKKAVMLQFALGIMETLAETLDLQLLRPKGPACDEYDLLTPPFTECALELGEIPLGIVAHELGTIPMPNSQGKGGIVDENLEMQYGWTNVSVCDLSVFPVSPAANPALSLTALALRHSDHLLSWEKVRRTRHPIRVYNLTEKDVYVCITESGSFIPSAIGGSQILVPSQPVGRHMSAAQNTDGEMQRTAQPEGIASTAFYLAHIGSDSNNSIDTPIVPGAYRTYMRGTREAMFVSALPFGTEYGSTSQKLKTTHFGHTTSQPVWPGIAALIVTPPSHGVMDMRSPYQRHLPSHGMGWPMDNGVGGPIGHGPMGGVEYPGKTWLPSGQPSLGHGEYNLSVISLEIADVLNNSIR
jgi:hypothetical protein